MNIDELDSVGNKICEWCFLPEGNLAAGDVTLAQKIALKCSFGPDWLHEIKYIRAQEAVHRFPSTSSNRWTWPTCARTASDRS